jgi:glucokinase
MTSESGVTVGVDLGGTKVETAVVDDSGRVVASRRHATDPDSGYKAVIEAIIESVNGFVGAYPVRGVGVGVAGQIDTATGTVRFAPNLKWNDVPLGPELSKGLGLPTVVINDVQAAAWGEFSHGAGKGATDMVALFVGTGIGGGIVEGGRLLKGDSGAAGELGHTTVVAGGRKCHCPNHGCLEAYAGGWAIADRAREAIVHDAAAGRVLLRLAGSLENVTAAVVSQAFHDSDPLSVQLVEETGRYLASGIVSIVNGLNPSILILGGGIIEGTPELPEIIEPQVRARALPVALESLKLSRAALGNNAGVIGAAAIALSLGS